MSAYDKPNKPVRSGDAQPLSTNISAAKHSAAGTSDTAPLGYPESPLRSMHIPFCINAMSYGSHEDAQTIAYSSFRCDDPSASDETMHMIYADQLKLHHHDYYELMYVIEGEVTQVIGKQRMQYTKGQACLTNCYTDHYETIAPDSFFVFLCMSRDFLSNLVLSSDPKFALHPNLAAFLKPGFSGKTHNRKDFMDFSPNIFRTPGTAGTKLVNTLLEDMIQELLRKQPGYLSILNGLLLRLLQALQNPLLYRFRHMTPESTSENRLFEQITYLMEHRNGRVTRTELSQALNYNSDYINRITKKHTGMNLSEYNQVICLKKAEHLLVETSMNISDIINLLGFENKTHFYKLFSLKHHMTPRAYRLRYRPHS